MLKKTKHILEKFVLVGRILWTYICMDEITSSASSKFGLVASRLRRVSANPVLETTNPMKGIKAQSLCLSTMA